VPLEIQPLVMTGVRSLIFFPILVAAQSYYRALLMLANHTAPIYQGMFVGFISTGASIALLLRAGIEPLNAAALAMTLGLAFELAYLWWAQRHVAVQLLARWQAQAVASAAGD
jgi:hypothetical protein